MSNNQNKIKSVAVFCGSKTGTNPLFIEHSKQLGKLLAQQNITLIYGAGSVGIMGAVANAALENGGEVVGIIPQLLVDWEQQHNGITQLIVVDDMHTRKKLLYQKSEAVIILPGGNGTLDELFEILTWNTLKIHEKKVYILNTDGFYNHIINHFETMYQQGFLYDNWNSKIAVCNTPQDIINLMLQQ
jgi:uncharacterized protein (TIGR00730 family)